MESNENSNQSESYEVSEPKKEQHSPDDFLVGEETENIKPTGVDDKSTGMEGDDYLGETNTKNSD